MNGEQPTQNARFSLKLLLGDPVLMLGLAATVLLFSSMLLSALTPLPLFYFYVQRGRTVGLSLIGLAGGIILILFFWLSSVSGLILLALFLEYSLLAGIMAECLLLKMPPEKVVGYPAAAILALGLVVLTVLGMVNGQNPINFGREIAERQVGESVKLYQDILSESGKNIEPAGRKTGAADGVDQGVLEGTKSIDQSGDMVFHQAARALVFVFPGLMTIITLTVSWMNFMLGRVILRKTGLLPLELADLTRWQPPEILIWAVIICGFCAVLPVTGLRFIGLNGLLILGLVYFLAGLSVIAFWFNLKNVPRFFRILLYVIIAVQQVLALPVAVLGLFDLWFDFRKLKKAESGPAS